MFYFLLILSILLTNAQKTLVIIHDITDKTTFSNFLRQLKNRGHKLEFKSASESSIKLESFGQFHYDNLLVLSPTSKKLGDLSSKHLMSFLDSGRNVFLAINENPSKMFKNTILSSGLEVMPKSFVADHFSNNELAKDSKNDTYIATRAVFGHPVVAEVENPVIFRGVGFNFKEKTQFGLHLLTGESTSYNSKSHGKTLGLVSAIQLRNNARFTVCGSTEFLTNAFAIESVKVRGKESPSGNGAFVDQAVAWTFQERGAIRTRNARHFLVDLSGPMNPSRYTVTEKVRYEVIIEEYDITSGEWKPYQADDVVFQLVRLDPFIRQTMSHDGNGLFFYEFTLPDTYGVFKFILDYKRKGWSYLYEEVEASIRPLRHDQHDRFLVSAWPYYASMISMVLGFGIFSFLFLHSSEPQKSQEKED